MPRIELAPEVAQDFDRIIDHLHRHEADDTIARIGGIIAAIDVLETSPLIGRPAEQGKRELMIGQSSRGYVALYRYIPGIDAVFVLAVRAQREAGFAR